MRLVEYRILMPLTVEENYIGQLWSMAEVSRLNTGGGEGVEILKNEFFPVPINFTDFTKYLPDYELELEQQQLQQQQHKEKKLHSSKSLGALSKLFKREGSVNSNHNNNNNNNSDDKTNGHHNNNNNNSKQNGSSNDDCINKHHNFTSFDSHDHRMKNCDSNSELSIYSSLPNSMDGSVDGLTTKFDKTYINNDVATQNGQYTYKIYKIASKFPWFIRKILPKESTLLHERSWNLYPTIKTHIRNEYMKEKFHVYINTITKECINGRIEDNVHNLTQEQLDKREIIVIDISEPVPNEEYVADEDPTKFHSRKAKRGPLKDDWISTQRPLICCYKLIDLEFVWFGLQTKGEGYMVNMYKKLFKKFHRQIFCWMDKWYDLKIEDVRKYEIDLQKSLSEKIQQGELAANPFAAEPEQ